MNVTDKQELIYLGQPFGCRLLLQFLNNGSVNLNKKVPTMNDGNSNEQGVGSIGKSRGQFWVFVFLICVLAVCGVVALFFLLPGAAPEGPAATGSGASTSTPAVTETATEAAAKAGTKETVLSSPTSIVPARSANENDTAFALYIVTLVAAVTALISVLVSFYLYRWRRIFIAGHPSVLVPEEWVSAIRGNENATKFLSEEVQQQFASINKFLGDNATRLEERTSNQSGEIRKLAESLLTLQNALDERDREIAPVETGFRQPRISEISNPVHPRARGTSRCPEFLASVFRRY